MEIAKYHNSFTQEDEAIDLDPALAYILEGMIEKSQKKTPNQMTIYDIYFEEDRKKFENETVNLSKKIRQRFVNADWFRKNMFNAATRGKHEKYNKFKTIFENKKTGEKIQISHPLHQKHADVLSILLTDYASAKIREDGRVTIFSSLYYIAKKMGYKYPDRASARIKQYIDEIRLTDFKMISPKMGISNFTILGDSDWSNRDGSYYVDLSIKSAKVLTMSTGLYIDKKLNEKIFLINDATPKLKALIRYVIANKKPITGYYTLKHIFDKYSIGKGDNEAINRKNRSVFRKELRDNIEILGNFNIKFDGDNNRIYYSGHEKIKFEMGVSLPEISEKLRMINRDEFIGMYFEVEPNILATIKTIKEEDGLINIEAHIKESNKNIKIKKVTKEDFKKALDNDANKYYNE